MDHPCAKHDGKDFYWCNVEANTKNWTWDYCAPVFDRNEYLGYNDFRGNFDYDTDELPIPLLTPALYDISGLKADHESIGFASGGDYPFVFRLLSNGSYERQAKGEGFRGLQSRSSLDSHTRTDNITRWSIIEHVANNPKTTPWISTSRNLRRQESLINRNIMNDPQHKDIYMDVIDLHRLGNTNIVDLSKETNRKSFLGNNKQVRDYAAAWGVLLIHWEVPSEAIIESVRYYYDAARDMTQYEVLRNPNYSPEPATEPRAEIGNFPDKIDQSRYP